MKTLVAALLLCCACPVALPNPPPDPVAPSEKAQGKISVDYPDEEISTILHDVANRFDLDLVLPTSVNGRATVKLKHVTWRQIFSATLPPYYAFVLEGNVVRVARLQSPERTPGCQGGYLIPIKSPTR